MHKPRRPARRPPSAIEVTVPPGTTGPFSQPKEYTLPGAAPGDEPIRVRVRVALIPPEDVVVVNGIRCTSVIRTLIDLSAEVSDAEAVRLIRVALARGLVTEDQLTNAAIERTDLTAIASFRSVLHAMRSGTAPTRGRDRPARPA